MKTTVVYLSWIPYGINLLKQFIYSYQTFPANSPHQLLLIFNGVNKETDYQPFLDFAKSNLQVDVKYIVLKSGQDIYAYAQAAKNIDTEYVLFLNSFSKILASNWLSKFENAFIDESVGAVSATASKQSHLNNVFENHAILWEPNKSFNYNFRKYKLFVKTIFYWYFIFKPFPSFHLRTSGFMLQKNNFLQLKNLNATTKFKAYIFENGRNSFTNQIIQLGLKTVIIDKVGNLYDHKNAHASNTFWMQNQQNLLIADNQTELYANATLVEKITLSKKAWGKYA